jgi:hypothetical protein
MAYWDSLRPQPPAWALEAGLPAPLEGENFVRYVTRLGLDSGYFFEELTAQTAELANLRLGSYLIDAMPDAFREHVHALSLRYLSDHRRRELVLMAERLWPRYRDRRR